jgi:hypothetical protein
MAKSRVTDESDDDAPERGASTSTSSASKQGAAARRSGTRAGANRRKRGRTIVAIVLIGFVLVASAVIWRRSYGVTQGRVLTALALRKTQLEAERASLEDSIRDESSRTRLGPVVQALGMRVPLDQQVRILPQ